MRKPIKRNYVSLDVETSSLDVEAGEIIEIGAAKFDKKGEEIDNFNTLIKNREEVPKLALVITGIKECDLKKAPAFEEIKEKLQVFLKDSIIIGHNVNFDINFLKKNGVKIDNQIIDTWHLSAILLPNLGSHSLESLTLKLKIGHPEKHRALDDAKASFNLFLFLKEKIKEIDLETRKEIKKYLQKDKNDLAILFDSKEFKKPGVKISCRKEVPFQKIDFKELERILAINKPQKNLKSEFNEEEIKLFQEISLAFMKNRNLIIEIPPTIKKNLIYIFTSLYYSKNLNKKIILAISESSWPYAANKIVPALKNILPFSFKVSFFDRREKYFCLFRFDKFKKKTRYDKKELILLIKLLLLQRENDVKKINEVSAFFEERKFLEKLTARLPFCLQEKCEYFKNKECLYYKDLLETSNANIVVIPHSFIYSKNQGYSFPLNSSFIIDKAEALENAITNNLSYQLSDVEIIDILDEIIELVISLKDQEGLKDNIKKIKNKVIIFFSLIGIFLKKAATGQTPNFIDFLIEERFRDDVDFKKIKDSLPGLIESLKNIADNLASLNNKKIPFLNHDLSAYQIVLENICLKFKNMILSPEKKELYKVIFRGKEISLLALPKEIQIKQLLKETSPLVLVSDSASIGNKFDYFKEKISLKEKFEEVVIPPSLKETKKTFTFVVKDFSTTDSYFIEKISKFILDISPYLKRKIIIALPSLNSIQKIFEKVGGELKNKNIGLFPQRIGGGTSKIIEHFKKSDKAILLATYNFLNYVSLPKKGLVGIVITRLPFEFSYSTPEIDGKEYFLKNSLPKSILKIKTIYNILLESKSEEKFFLILDNRVFLKEYGRYFLNILPTGKTNWTTEEDAHKVIAKYL